MSAATDRPKLTDDAVRALHAQRYNIPMLMEHFGRCRNTIDGRLRKLQLVPNKNRRPKQATKRQTTHQARPILDKPITMPAVTNAALMEARTIYPNTVVAASEAPRLLVEGVNSKKIGARITKGKWKDFPVFTLTFEERASCPKSCAHWRSCFGNTMHFARRIRHDDPELMPRLTLELHELQKAHPNGFAVRLHVLGDFFSPEYVQFWERKLDAYPALHVFGFSARHDYHADPIAKALIDLTLKRWDRFAVRFSNAPIDACSTVSIEHPFQKPADAVICPQQLGKTTSCSTCALCWQSKRRIAFIRH